TPGEKWPSSRDTVRFVDNLDGSYSAVIDASQDELDAGALLVHRIGGVNYSMQPLPLPMQRWWSVHIGQFFGSTSGAVLDTDIELPVSPHFSLEAQVNAKLFGSSVRDIRRPGTDSTWVGLSAWGKSYLHRQTRPKKYAPFAAVGVGVVGDKSQWSPSVAVTAGTGIDVRGRFRVDVSVFAEQVLGPGDDPQHWGFRVALKLRRGVSWWTPPLPCSDR
ncbi:MAG: hypothetical protein HKN37_11080, partial [Rhodothermales bacterium]|nr:hypothetical protein [Rhodothermales bacterium]